MSWIEAILLGIVQGLTEFLPVSSSGHLAIGKALFGIETADLSFEVIVHAATVLATVKAYDEAVMSQGKVEFPDVGKGIASRCIGNVEKDENGNYLPDTYDLEGADLIVRLMAPSTHHTMGGIVVDTKRHVLDADGNIIPGLYAAGEVTGGIHGGNRLGGNAIVEIFVSGRTAANTIAEENK